MKAMIMTKQVEARMRYDLAKYAHEAWSGWMKYLFEKSTINTDMTATIPAWAVTRWKRQVETDYELLLPGEKMSDLSEADKIINIARKHLYGKTS